MPKAHGLEPALRNHAPDLANAEVEQLRHLFDSQKPTWNPGRKRLFLCLDGPDMPMCFKGGLAREQSDQSQKPIGRKRGFGRGSTRRLSRPVLGRLNLRRTGCP